MLVWPFVDRCVTTLWLPFFAKNMSYLPRAGARVCRRRLPELELERELTRHILLHNEGHRLVVEHVGDYAPAFEHVFQDVAR